tara:strand:+ start:546 stop:737 length:192 start_codon:yes stop_codon:yes gene_type:complete
MPRWVFNLSIHRTDSLPKGEGVSICFECLNLYEYLNELIKKEIFLANSNKLEMALERSPIKRC